MRRRLAVVASVGALVAAASSILPAQGPAADIILSNGKIITVDERFTIAQAAADPRRSHRRGRHRPGDRPARRTVDPPHRSARTGGRPRAHRQSHAPAARRHDVAAGRCAGTASDRASRRWRCCARARSAAPAGEWVYNLGGWAIEQFADDKQAVHARGARSRGAEQSGAAAGVVLRGVSEQPRAAGARRRESAARGMARARRVGAANRADHRGRRPRGRRTRPDRQRRAARSEHAADVPRPEQDGADGVRQRRLRGERAAALSAAGRAGTAERAHVLHLGRRRRHAAGGRASCCRASPR